MRSYHLGPASGTLLTPALRRYLAKPILRLLPRSLPANAITLVAHGSLFAVPFVAAIEGHTRPVAASCAIVVLILLFVIGDELDGMQAFRIQGTSPLGEFLDHYLDSFVSGTLLYTAYALYDISSLELLLPTIGCTFLTGAAMYYEQHHTGTMIFEAISTTESLALAAVLAGLSPVAAARQVAHVEVAPGSSLLAVFLLATSFAILAPTVTRSFLRSKVLPPQWVAFAVGLAGVIAGILLTTTGLAMAAAIVVLYGCSHAGSVILRHLRDGRVPFPDPVAPIALLASAVAARPLAPFVQIAALAYLGIRCAWTSGVAAVFLDRPRESDPARAFPRENA